MPILCSWDAQWPLSDEHAPWEILETFPLGRVHQRGVTQNQSTFLSELLRDTEQVDIWHPTGDLATEPQEASISQTPGSVPPYNACEFWMSVFHKNKFKLRQTLYESNKDPQPRPRMTWMPVFSGISKPSNIQKDHHTCNYWAGFVFPTRLCLYLAHHCLPGWCLVALQRLEVWFEGVSVFREQPPASDPIEL